MADTFSLSTDVSLSLKRLQTVLDSGSRSDVILALRTASRELKTAAAEYFQELSKEELIALIDRL